MRWLKKLPRRAGRGVAWAAIILAVAAAGAYLWLRTSLPMLDGTVRLTGPHAPITILRDADGIPTIRATSNRDAYFALGYVHAQDRLWQMDMMRRFGGGRMAELLGPWAAGIDRFTRTLGLYRLAEASLTHLAPPVRAALNAYSEGVNAYLATHRGALPAEFNALAYHPAPWRPADSLVWQRQMALFLQGNWRDEALRAEASSFLKQQEINDLWPNFNKLDSPPIHASLSTPAMAGVFAALMRAWPDALAPRRASNAWALGGTHTQSGKPLLANDPHLGYRAPGIWYLARIEAPNLHLTGATTPGVPFMILGQNQHIAWGMTTTHSDAQDLFIERTDPTDPTRYLTPDGPRPFDIRRETIPVRAGKDIELTVRATRHGPVVSDLTSGPLAGLMTRRGAGEVIALAAPALRPDDLTAEAIYEINRAKSWADFIAASAKFHSPQQNLFYADRAGNIGFIAPGRIPIRAQGDGSVPAPGWDGTHDWRGFIPFDALPRALNPPSGRLANANNRIVDGAYPYHLGNGWAEGYRAKRLESLLNGAAKADWPAMAVIQRDARSLMARDLLPVMLRANSSGPQARQALSMLAEWDGTMDRTRAEPLIFSAWFAALPKRLYGDELGALAGSFRGPRPRVIKRMLSTRQVWCDDIATSKTESCVEILGAALDAALDTLSARFGKDMAQWRWGDAHVARFRHQFFGFIPGLGALSDLTIPADGGGYTLNRAASRDESERGGAGFEAVHGPGLRAIYDLADPKRSRFVIATGQSGNVLSPLYGNQMRRWRDGDYIAMAMRPARHRLTLLPLNGETTDGPAR